MAVFRPFSVAFLFLVSIIISWLVGFISSSDPLSASVAYITSGKVLRSSSQTALTSPRFSSLHHIPAQFMDRFALPITVASPVMPQQHTIPMLEPIDSLPWFPILLCGSLALLGTLLRPLQRPQQEWVLAAAEGSAPNETKTEYFYLDDIGYVVLAKAEIPAMIPRLDLMTQVKNWAKWHFEARGYELYGLKMPVTAMEDEEGKSLSFRVKIPTLNPQYPIVELEVGMDDNAVMLKKLTKETGWGIQKTFNMHIDEDRDVHAVIGRYFVVRIQKGPVPVPYDAKPAITYVLQCLSGAVDRYYTFGSPFKFDAT